MRLGARIAVATSLAVCISGWGHLVTALDPIAVLVADDGPPWDFGKSVAISGNNIVVGAPSDPIENGDQNGAIYVFRRYGPQWIQHAKLIASDPTFQGMLGWSVDIDGDVIVAGAPEWSFDSCDIRRPGAGYVFRRNDQGTPQDRTDDTWNEEAKLVLPESETVPGLGMSVAIDGNVIVVGTDCGERAVVFRYSQGAWVNEGSLFSPDPEPWEAFGSSVDLEGDRIIVGAPSRDASTGASFLFHRVGTVWIDERTLTASNGVRGDFFGQSVSLAGFDVAVGAPGRDRPGVGFEVGSMYIFHRDASAGWLETQEVSSPIESSDSNFGYSVSYSDGRIMVGNRGVPKAYLLRSEGCAWEVAEPIFGPPEYLPPFVAIDGRFGALSTHIYAIRDRWTLFDFQGLQVCFTGTNEGSLPVDCKHYDLSDNDAVDLKDFEDFVGTLVGPRK